MKLVDNARDAWRWFSVQAFTLAGSMQVTWLSLPADMKAIIPDEWVMWATVAVCVLGVVGRLTKQGDAE